MVDEIAGNSMLGSSTQHVRGLSLSQKPTQTPEPNSSSLNINTLAASPLAILGQASLTLEWKRTFFFQIKIFH